MCYLGIEEFLGIASSLLRGWQYKELECNLNKIDYDEDTLIGFNRDGRNIITIQGGDYGYELLQASL